jgi:predicted ATPase
MTPAPTDRPPVLPTGTVAFLFTDIEGSTRRWEVDPAAMAVALERHNALLRAAIRSQGGVPFKTIGDAFQAAFDDAAQAVAAAVAAQRALADEAWGPVEPLRVRMAVHVGAAEPDERGDYTAPSLNRLARLLATGYGGQVLLTEVAAQLAREGLPAGVTLRALGSHRLRDLLAPEAVVQLVIPGLPADFPPLKSLAEHPNNLPVAPTPLVGRAAELADLAALLADPARRLVTLTGPGGVGKTRLALQAAADNLEAFPDGVFLASLGQVEDPAAVPWAIAAAVGVRAAGQRGEAEALEAWLVGRTTLLVLDNLEQLVAAAPFVSRLLAAAPGLKVLATSREALRLRGEVERPVAPLPLPEPADEGDPARLAQVPAVQLFVERARAARPDFSLSARNAAAVAEICERLDGLPLAIELAAARVRLFPTETLLARLKASGGTLSLLTGGARDLPARQQALRDTIAWSHALLEPDEQAVFRRLGVFAGGATLEAAEAVIGGSANGSSAGGTTASGGMAGGGPEGGLPTLDLAVLDGLASLVDKSLLRQEERIGEPCFRLLRTIRDYAAAQLEAAGETDAARRAHAAYFLWLAETAQPELIGAEQERWLNRLAAEHDDLRAALGWAAAAGEAELGLRLAGALWRFWFVRGHLAEGRALLAAALAVPGGEAFPAARGRALNGAGVLAIYQADLAAARSLLTEALDLARHEGDMAGIVRCLNNLGIVEVEVGEYDAAAARYEEALMLARELGEPYRVAGLLHSMGAVVATKGDYAAAEPLFRESLAIKEASGDKEGAAASLANLGLIAQRLGRWAEARALLERSLAMALEIDDQGTIAGAQQVLGLLDLAEGDPAAARARHLAALAIRHRMGDEAGVENSFVNLAGVAVAEGRPEQAGRLLGAAEAIRRRHGLAVPEGERAEYDETVARTRKALGETAFHAAWQAGHLLPLDEAVIEAGLDGGPDPAAGPLTS